ncbi:MAG: UDP-N-acetyl-D-galactosamine dehydrogenase [Zhongshania sp.]|jgi:UDP-N-acetyl-D-galactosamine dehydrogenase
MGAYVASKLVKAIAEKCIHVDGAKMFLMGLTFKENCPDLRNTKVIDIVAELREYNNQVDVHDPWLDAVEADVEYGITPVAEPSEEGYDGIIVAVAHRQFKAMDERAIRAFGQPKHVL